MKCAKARGDAAENTAIEMSNEKDDVLVKVKQAENQVKVEEADSFIAANYQYRQTIAYC